MSSFDDSVVTVCTSLRAVGESVTLAPVTAESALNLVCTVLAAAFQSMLAVCCPWNESLK